MDISDLDESTREGNVAKLHDATASFHGDHLAVESYGNELTHAELRDASARFAGGLHELGLEPDDSMLLYLPNIPQFLIAAMGGFKAGVWVSPVNPQYKHREISYQLEDAEAKAIVTHEALRDNVTDTLEEVDDEPIVITVGDRDNLPEGDLHFDDVGGDPVMVDRADDDVALLVYTSGTTGRPKGVQLTHRNHRAQTLSILSSPNDEVEDTEIRSLIWLPLYHITGFTHTAWQPLVRGGSLFLRSAAYWDPEDAMELIEREGITHWVGVTAMYVDMVNHESFGDHDLTSIVSASEGGAKMSVAVQREFEESSGVEISEGYGLTETNGATHAQVGSSFGLRHGTIGQPTRMTEARIVDQDGNEVPIGEEGELLVRGPQVMKGYHDRPDADEAAFTEAGFFRTGDVARRDHDNYYEIVDRKKHVIVSAGYNIYPSEVEEFLHEHEDVAEAAVVGVPDKRRNEVPKAFVVLRPGVEAGVDVTEEEIKQYCLDNIAQYKHPRMVEFVEELPRTTSGKIQKFKLAEGEGDDGEETVEAEESA